MAKFITFILLILFTVSGTLAQDEGFEGENRDTKIDYKNTWDPSSSKSREAFFSSSNPKWDQLSDPQLNQYFDEIPAEKHASLGDRVNSLSTENIGKLRAPEALKNLKGGPNGNIRHANTDALQPIVNELTPEQREGLSFDQTSKLFNTIAPEKQRDLNPPVVNRYLSDVSGKQVSVIFGKNGIGGRTFPGGFEIAKAQDLRIGDTLVSEGNGIVFANNTLTVTAAKSFLLRNQTGASDFEGLKIQAGGIEFFVESAKEIQSFCNESRILSLKNVSKTTFKESKIDLKIQPHSTAPLKIEDCTGTKGTIQGTGEVTIIKDHIAPKYIAKNISLDFALDINGILSYENVSS